MIPKKLTIEGIYSYQKREVIDFEKLTTNALFGIFGRVGSGKSSILEAISYVLYGRIERLNQREELTYNMMNLKSYRLFIDYEFSINSDKRYKFTVEIKRGKKRFRDIKSPERLQYVWENGEWQPKSLDAKDVLDLDYENFRRTIIIPQGKFQEFLQLKEADRSTMLKDIFHLQRFDLQDKLKPISKNNQDILQRLQTQIEGLLEVTKLKIQEEEEHLAKAREQLDANRKKLEKSEKYKTEQEELKTLFADLQSKTKTLENLRKEEDSWESLENQIKAYKTCQAQFKDLIERLEGIQKNIADTQRNMEAKSQGYSKLQEELKEKQSIFEKTKTDFEQKENWKNDIKDLKQTLEIQKLTEDLNEIKVRIAKGKPYLEEKLKLITEHKAELEVQEKKHQEKKLELPDMVLLNKVDSWFQEKGNILSNIQRIEQSIKLHNKDIDKILAEKNTVSEAVIIQNQDDIGFLIKDIEYYKKEKEAKKKKVQKQIINLTAQQKLEEFAQHLHDHPNEVCPLCGSTEHPKIWEIENTKQEIQDLEREANTEEEQIADLDEVLKKLRNCQTRIKAKQKEIVTEQKKAEREKKSLDKHFGGFQSRWKSTFEPHNESEVKRQKDKASRLDKSIKTFEEKIKQTKASLEEAQKAKEQYQSELDKLDKDALAVSTQISTLEKNIQRLNLSEFIQKDKNTLQENIEHLDKKYKATVEDYANLSQTIQDIQKEERKLDTQLTVDRNTLEKDKSNLEKIKSELKNRMLKAGFEDMEAVKAVLKQNIDIEEAEERIKSFYQELRLNQDKIKELKVKIKNRAFEEDAYQTLLESIRNLKESIKEQSKTEGELEGKIKRMEKDLAKKIDLEKQLKEKELRQSDISTLESLFRSRGFVKYISSMYLQGLCELANHRFYRLTNQRLQLEVDDRNNFLVRDFLNNGQVRSVKTLSGGQTFQAALSLALALADSIQRFNKSPQNFFFLDEGFGSQDEESLEIVFNTLKSLQQENRIVGIISHVEKLQREIPVFLKVHNDEEKGSEIERSWEVK